MRDFKKILAWQKADDLAVTIYQITGSFPPEERYGLTSQFRRAAVSIAANIAEGSGKQTLKDFLNYLYTARGSLAEVEYYIHLSGRLNYLNGSQVEQCMAQQKEVGQILQGFINSLTRQVEAGRSHN